eukprot:14824222-Alexandrium_andersonii.AAC.1
MSVRPFWPKLRYVGVATFSFVKPFAPHPSDAGRRYFALKKIILDSTDGAYSGVTQNLEPNLALGSTEGAR